MAGQPAHRSLWQLGCVVLRVGAWDDIIAIAVIDADARQWRQLRCKVRSECEVGTVPVGIETPEWRCHEKKPRDSQRAGLFRKVLEQHGTAERVADEYDLAAADAG